MSTKKTTPKELIVLRKQYISDIKKGWDQLRSFNSVEKKFKRPFDLKSVYKKIIEDSLSLVKVKVAIQAANMGFTNTNQLPKNSPYPSIFILSQLKEQKVKLNMLPTKGQNTYFTKNLIKKETDNIDKEIAKIETQLEEFNKNSFFEL